MGLWDKLRQGGNYLRKLRLSGGPDSYFRYKLGRDAKRREADHAAEHDREEAAHGRETAERERGYDERYARERERDG